MIFFSNHFLTYTEHESLPERERERERERENPKPHLKLSEKEFESALNLVSVQLEFPDIEKCYFFAILSWPVITIYLIYQGGTGNPES